MEEKNQIIKFSDMFETFIEVGNYFNTNYPGDKINTNLKPDIEKFFPNLTTQQLYDRENFIRKSILIFRWSKQKIAEIKKISEKEIIEITTQNAYKVYEINKKL